MRQQESVPVPRGWTGEAAWKGAGASLLLHLFVGAAMIVALSGPPKGPPQVIDLTLLPPAGIARRPVPPAFLAAVKPSRVPGRTVLPEPPALPASPPVANPPEVTPPASPSAAAMPASPSRNPACQGRAPIAPGSPHPAAAARPRQARIPWHRHLRQGVRRAIGRGAPGGGLRLDPRRHPARDRLPGNGAQDGVGGEGRGGLPAPLGRLGPGRADRARLGARRPGSGSDRRGAKRLPVPPVPRRGGGHHPGRLSADDALTRKQ